VAASPVWLIGRFPSCSRACVRWVCHRAFSLAFKKGGAATGCGLGPVACHLANTTIANEASDRRGGMLRTDLSHHHSHHGEPRSGWPPVLPLLPL